MPVPTTPTRPQSPIRRPHALGLARYPLQLAGLACAVGLLASPAAAGELAGLRVIDRTSGEALPIYRHEGRSYVAGVPGHAYELSLTNKTDERLMAIVSVDGVNALSGETAGTDQRGYVFTPHETDRIKGWRKSLETVARFTFASLPDSYAARTGRPDNVGVIGVALFRENQPEVSIEPEPPAAQPHGGYGNADRAAAPPMARAAPRPAPPPATDASDAVAEEKPAVRQRLGTGHGRRITDRIGTTTFERASTTPDEVLTIYYDARPALVARGIIPRSSPPRTGHAPEAFPGGFVPDP